MTTFYLVRHCLTDAVGKTLCGRMTGIGLSDQGRAQSHALAERLRDVSIAALYCSPLQRAVESAEPLARRLSLRIQTEAEISDIDYGAWTGREISELAGDPQWQLYNSVRLAARIPGGENILAVQQRFVRWMEMIRPRHSNDRIAVVSHEDPIKTAVMYYIGLPLDLHCRFEIAPASVSVLRITDNAARLLTLNNVGVLPL